MRYYVGTVFYGDDIWHYGVKGQKKGVRRYQNPDGSLKPEGYSHYGRNPNPRKRSVGFGFGKKVVAKAKEKGKEFREKHRRLSKVSDEEIRRRINRLKLENEYLDAKKKHKELTSKKKKQMSEGKKHVLSLIAQVGSTFIKSSIEAENKIDLQEAKFRDAKDTRAEARHEKEEERRRQQREQQQQQQQQRRQNGRMFRRQPRHP